jgi:hypothetical protein
MILNQSEREEVDKFISILTTDKGKTSRETEQWQKHFLI